MAQQDEMVGWHHRLDGHELEQTQGDSEGQESVMCYSPWGYKESYATARCGEQQQVNSLVNNSKMW